MDAIEKRRKAKEQLAQNLTISACETDPSNGVLSWLVSVLDNMPPNTLTSAKDWVVCVSFWQDASTEELDLIGMEMGWIPKSKKPGQDLPSLLIEQHKRLAQYVFEMMAI